MERITHQHSGAVTPQDVERRFGGPDRRDADAALCTKHRAHDVEHGRRVGD